jgi:hypothetical protein
LAEAACETDSGLADATTVLKPDMGGDSPTWLVLATAELAATLAATLAVGGCGTRTVLLLAADEGAGDAAAATELGAGGGGTAAEVGVEGTPSSGSTLFKLVFLAWPFSS